ncbi:MAG: hypothetical protein ABR500_06975 [Dermatophilaceae bacterium]
MQATSRQLRGREGRLARAVVAVALLAGLGWAVPSAQADAGLTVTSTSRYVLDADEQTVSATITMTLRNVAPDEETADGYRFYYYDSYGLPLPAEATDVRATSAGEPLGVERRSIAGQRGFRLFEVGFPDLLHPDSRTIELSFTLEGQPPRADDPTRIGPGYATFPVFGAGDPGDSTVEVVVPDGLTVDSTASSFTETPGEDGTTVYTTGEDNLAPGFAATMSVRGSDVGQERAVTVGGVDLVLVPYPDDPEWADFIEERADIGLPVLVDLLGQEWPGDIDRIREDSGSQVRGFEGWYSRSEREIVLGEALEDGILFHELAHAWVNTATIQDRWLSEGLAEFLAEETAGRTDGTFTTPASVQLDDRAAVPLQTWVNSPDFRGTEVDGWAYPASYQVVGRLLDGLAGEDLSALLSDIVTAASPWDLPGQRLLSGGALGTTTFLDLLDAHEAPASADGSATELYAAWVLDEADVARLEQRPDVTETYSAFAATSAWGPPLGIRRAMAGWEYDAARELMTERADLASAANTAQELSESTATELPERIRRAYEDADTRQELDAAAASITTATNALRRYEEARAGADAERGSLGRLGATVLRLEATADAAQDNITVGEFAASQSASDLTLARAAWATRLGVGIVAAAVVLLVLTAAVVVALARRTRRPAYA